VTHQSSVELASCEQAATTLNDSNAVSCTVPVFAGNDAVLFPGIRERIMTRIPGRPGMHSLPTSVLHSNLCYESILHSPTRFYESVSRSPTRFLHSNRLLEQSRMSLMKSFSCERSFRMFERHDCRDFPEASLGSHNRFIQQVSNVNMSVHVGNIASLECRASLANDV